MIKAQLEVSNSPSILPIFKFIHFFFIIFLETLTSVVELVADGFGILSDLINCACWFSWKNNCRNSAA